jgi:hypothetical protein
VLVVYSKQFRQIADPHCAMTRLKLFHEISGHGRIPPGVIRHLLEHRLEHDPSPVLFAYFAARSMAKLRRSSTHTLSPSILRSARTARCGRTEIKGFAQEYLDASSLRRQQIVKALSRSGFSGTEAAQIAAHNTRDKKVILSPAE